MLTHALYDKSASRSIVYLASVCDLTQRASVSMRKCADWVNLKFVYCVLLHFMQNACHQFCCIAPSLVRSVVSLVFIIGPWYLAVCQNNRLTLGYLLLVLCRYANSFSGLTN